MVLQCEDSLSEVAIRLCALVGINFKPRHFSAVVIGNPVSTKVLDRGPA